MVAILLGTGALVAASVVLGHAVLHLSGFSPSRWYAPAAGFGVLLILGGQIVWVPGRATTLGVLAVALTAGSLASGGVRAALRRGLPDAAPLAIGVVVLACIPFAVTGRAAILGVGVGDDLSAHLLAIWELRTHAGEQAVAAIGGRLLPTGYPIGPHGVAAMLAGVPGMGEVRAVDALLLTVPVLTALCALEALPARPRGPRWVVAALVGLAYLATAYFVQGLFKETIEGMVLVAGALAAEDVVRGRAPPGLRAGAPLAVLAAGALYAYSYPGLIWPLVAGGAVLAAELVRDGGRGAVLRRVVRPALGASLAGAVLIAPGVPRVVRFAGSFFASEPPGNKGNLFRALPVTEALGVWPAGDFRVLPAGGALIVALVALAAVALAGGLVWWWRRGRLGAPAALVAGALLWAYLDVARNPYNGARGLVVAAPACALCLGGPLAAAWGRRPPGRRRAPTAVVRAVGVVLALAAAASSFSVLRDARVGPGPAATELDSLRRTVGDHRVLFLGSDHYTQWELRGTRPYVTGRLYAPAHLGVHPQKPAGSPMDVDNFGPRDLDKVAWIITTDAAYQSQVPVNFHLARATRSFRLYRRAGPTPAREPLEPPGTPGAVLDCAGGPGRLALATYARAAVLPAPVTRPQSAWQGTPREPGDSARVRLRLPAGRWDVSLQYVSNTGLAIRAPGLATELPPLLAQLGPFWAAGTLTSTGRPLALTVTARPLPRLGRLLGATPSARWAAAPHHLPLDRVAFTRHGARPRLVPVRAACGRYVDFYVRASSG